MKSECYTDPATGLPLMFAPRGTADITASYTLSSPTRTIRIVVEASAMRFMPVDRFRNQLSQAVKHSRELQENDGQSTYALVINSAPILTYESFREMYRSMLKSLGIRDDPSLRLIAINVGDLALALCDLAFKLPADQFPFRTERLCDVLDVLYDGLLRKKQDPKPDWMRHVWSDIIVDEVKPELVL